MQPSFFFEQFVSRVSRLSLQHPKLSIKYLDKSRGSGDDELGVKNPEEMLYFLSKQVSKIPKGYWGQVPGSDKCALSCGPIDVVQMG